LGLLRALEEQKVVYLIFILDERQFENNPYRSDKALIFLFDSLSDLNSELKKKKSFLSVLYGRSDQIIHKLIKENDLKTVYSNFDYTPFSKTRDEQIGKICRELGAEFRQTHDTLLNEPNSVLRDDRTPYTIFTHFFRKASRKTVEEPKENRSTNYSAKLLSGAKTIEEFEGIFPKESAIKGGRKEALRILDDLEIHRNYTHERDIPNLDKTTHLSAHNKFGTVSIREVFHKIARELGPEHQLIREIYWRDFFTYIGYHFPHVFGKSFHQQFDQIKWNNKDEIFEKWTNGQTGFPIVDAGMRELNKTGFMHNRVRMIVASFLTKDLHIDWRKGEKYFAQKLVDYDPAVNNGNWQWAASTGCDAQPYFRIFNPWLQQERFDPQCIYIKRWVSELAGSCIEEIHDENRNKIINNYPLPMVDHSKEASMSKGLYAEVKSIRT
jgi:deoxyribodipyrimidine photo-lyase